MFSIIFERNLPRFTAFELRVKDLELLVEKFTAPAMRVEDPNLIRISTERLQAAFDQCADKTSELLLN